MSENSPDPAGEQQLSYAYRPSVLGAARAFRLTPDAIVWETGRHSGRIPWPMVTRVRLSFRPVTMQSHRFRTELWSQNGPRLEIISTSCKSMVEQERLDPAYVAFVRELHRRIAAAGSPVRYQSGVNPLIYWAGLTIFAATALGLAALIARAIHAQAWSGAAFIGAFLGLFLWQVGGYFRRNRPGVYRPEALPAELMPRI
jgi:hypothetical protein